MMHFGNGDKPNGNECCDRNVDDVHNLMDDVAEQQEIANEISDAISNPVGFQQDVDEVSRQNDPH